MKKVNTTRIIILVITYMLTISLWFVKPTEINLFIIFASITILTGTNACITVNMYEYDNKKKI